MSRFLICISQIRLIRIQINLDMLLRVEFGQQAHRLNLLLVSSDKKRAALTVVCDGESEMNCFNQMAIGTFFFI